MIGHIHDHSLMQLVQLVWKPMLLCASMHFKSYNVHFGNTAECHTPLGYVCTTGGWRRSQYCSRASLSECDTWVEAVVVQSTKYGYKPISCSHDDLSTGQIIFERALFTNHKVNKCLQLTCHILWRSLL